MYKSACYSDTFVFCNDCKYCLCNDIDHIAYSTTLFIFIILCVWSLWLIYYPLQVCTLKHQTYTPPRQPLVTNHFTFYQTILIFYTSLLQSCSSLSVSHWVVNGIILLLKSVTKESYLISHFLFLNISASPMVSVSKTYC